MAVPLLRTFRNRRRVSAYYVFSGRWVRLRKWLTEQLPAVVFALQFLLTVVISVHLAVALVAPGGHNTLLEQTVPPLFAYQTWLPSGNAIGFPEDTLEHRFLFFKIFAQDGSVVEGSLPDRGAYNLLRYDRWSKVGSVVSGDVPVLHRHVLDYLLERLPQPPLKLELYTGTWKPLTNELAASAKPGRRQNQSITIELLGTYDGLHGTWTPEHKKKGV